MEAINDDEREAELKEQLWEELKKRSDLIDWSLVIRILTENENAVHWRDGRRTVLWRDIRRTVLHEACHGEAPSEVVQHIHGLWSDAINERDCNGDLPIHDAARYQSHGVIKFLTRGERKASLNERNIHGSLPLHGAIHDTRRPIEVFQLLIERGGPEPVAAPVIGRPGLQRLPLHVACGHQQSLEVIKLLVKFLPEATTTRDSEGMLPIDLARQAFHPNLEVKVEVIEWLEELEQVEKTYKRIRNLDGTDLNDLEKYLTSEPGKKKQATKKNKKKNKKKKPKHRTDATTKTTTRKSKVSRKKR